MWIVKNKIVFFILSGLILLACIFSIFKFGLNFGIDFTGGTLLQVEYKTAPNIDNLQKDLDALNIGKVSIQPSGDTGVILRTKSITEQERTDINTVLQKQGESTETSFANIGPTIGNELKHKAYVAIIIVIILILLFISWAFRKAGGEISAWTYGLMAIVAMFHDVIIPTGVFTILAHFKGGFEIDALYITAILATMGFSVHDTIVVFDRIRENLTHKNKESFDEVVGKSLTQTMARSINTSLTVFIVLIAMYFFGGASTKEFSLVFIIGIIAGTYSSIFIASPLLTLFKRKNK